MNNNVNNNLKNNPNNSMKNNTNNSMKNNTNSSMKNNANNSMKNNANNSMKNNTNSSMKNNANNSMKNNTNSSMKNNPNNMGSNTPYVYIDRKDITRMEKSAKRTIAGTSDGCIRTVQSKGSFQYYKKMQSDEKYTYVRKEDMEEARGLAQRKYAKDFLKAAQKAKEELKILNSIDPYKTLTQVYDSMPIQRKAIVAPYIADNDSIIEKWKDEKAAMIRDYWINKSSDNPIDSIRSVKRILSNTKSTAKSHGKSTDQSHGKSTDQSHSKSHNKSNISSILIPDNIFSEGNNFITEQGEIVRSKSEAIIADKLNLLKIPYFYEVPKFLNGIGYIKPDFTILNPFTLKEYYWEHFGLMDNPDYEENALHKIEIFSANGICLGCGLIISFETKIHPLDTSYISTMINTFLLSKESPSL